MNKHHVNLLTDIRVSEHILESELAPAARQQLERDLAASRQAFAALSPTERAAAESGYDRHQERLLEFGDRFCAHVEALAAAGFMQGMPAVPALRT